ncbi:MAG: GNAT family N-acetyltransferase [Gammaproteobacteria bacterium]|nr:MAG: GNAT family N-acetyltransferase [Gammaproteobacteria bacterium]
MTYNIITTNWQTHREFLREIRDQVFIQEQQVPVADEWDDKDETAKHFLVLDNDGKPVGCARVLIEKNLFHIGRVAVLAKYRKLGIGRELMQHVLLWCRQQNSEHSVYLHAQTTRMEFYEHLGFVAQGDIFMDAGIEHIEMWYQH